ncbi:Protein YOP1 [Cyberlindnera fabianii]|uniref:Protein YOP1 n=1 Tax=Cyberlindnera fabianii TaxID=36022 RepID=A0A1V2L8M4_CYBFA|nr:Protein YOP1 [Cyberlindnera fabianii]
MSDFASQIQSHLKGIDAFAGNHILTQFEQASGLPRSYAIVGAGVLYFFLIFINVGGIGQLLSNIAGFVIPGYLSLKALNTESTKDDTELLTYWVVFAFLNVIEFWSKAILYWIPFYWFMKTIFLLYLSLPQFGGAQVVYGALIKPLADKWIGATPAKKVADRVDQAAEGLSTGVGY